MKKLLSTFLKKINIKSAKGIYLYTKSGKIITDLTAGYTGHAILGWGNKKILQAISKQSKKFCHIDYKVFEDENREKLASLILSNKINKLDKVFLVGSSGAEACEAAMKMSYQYFYDLGFKEKNIYFRKTIVSWLYYTCLEYWRSSKFIFLSKYTS